MQRLELLQFCLECCRFGFTTEAVFFNDGSRGLVRGHLAEAIEARPRALRCEIRRRTIPPRRGGPDTEEPRN